MTRNKRGITLIELLIALALAGIVVTAAYAALSFGRKSLAMSSDEYEMQSSMRMALEKTNQSIRMSTALFTIPEASFREDNLTAGWNYIGILNVEVIPARDGNPAVMGSEIVSYIYDATTYTHKLSVLLPAKANISYKLVVDKSSPSQQNKLVQIGFQGYRNDNGTETNTMSVNTELEALNSLQVVDYGTSTNPAVAIAYRSDTRTPGVVGNVAMVLDTSGSMSNGMNGSSGVSEANKRITILKSDAIDMINKFAQEDNVNISLVPFATSANNPRPFRNAKSSRDALVSDINSLTANGGTNTGDGLRRAYYGLKNQDLAAGPGVNASNYAIILVDGVTTFGTVYSNTNRNYYTVDGSINEGYLDRTPYNYASGQIVGNGATLDAKGTAYVKQIGSLIKAGSFAKVYVIGFSSVSADLGSINDIATSCGAASNHVYSASNSAQLSNIFDEIRTDIVNDLWYLRGPGL